MELPATRIRGSATGSHWSTTERAEFVEGITTALTDSRESGSKPQMGFLCALDGEEVRLLSLAGTTGGQHAEGPRNQD